MKKEIAARLVKKDGTASLNYQTEIAWVVDKIGEGEKSYRFHCCQWSRSCGRYSLIDNRSKVEDVLKAMGIPYTYGNDSKRGGMEGKYIEATFDGRNRAVALIRKSDLKTLRSEWRIGRPRPQMVLFNQIIKGEER